MLALTSHSPVCETLPAPPPRRARPPAAAGSVLLRDGTFRAAGLAGNLIEQGIAFNGIVLISTVTAR
jgi:hypothetical protein